MYIGDILEVFMQMLPTSRRTDGFAFWFWKQKANEII